MRKFSIQHSRKTRDILDFPALEFGKNERFTTQCINLDSKMKISKMI